MAEAGHEIPIAVVFTYDGLAELRDQLVRLDEELTKKQSAFKALSEITRNTTASFNEVSKSVEKHNIRLRDLAPREKETRKKVTDTGEAIKALAGDYKAMGYSSTRAWRMAAKDVARLTPMLRRLGLVGEESREFFRALASTTEENRRLLTGFGLTAAQQREVLRTYHQEGIEGALRQAKSFQSLNRVIDLVSDRYAVYTQRIMFANRAIQLFASGQSLSEEAMVELSRALNLTTGDTRFLLAAYREYERQNLVLRATNEVVRHQIGAIGQGWRMVGRAAFWAGLGTMFVTMSIARANRALHAITLAYRTLSRVQEDVKESQEEYRRAVMLYGKSSEEAKNAARALRDAYDRLEMAQLRVREAHEGWNLTLLMLALGTIPTLIRGASDLVTSIRYLAASMFMNRIITEDMSAVEMKLAVALSKQLGTWTLLRGALTEETGLKAVLLALDKYHADTIWNVTLAKEGNKIVTEYLTTAEIKEQIARGTNIIALNAETAATWQATRAKLALWAATGVGIVVMGAAIASMLASQAAIQGMIDRTETLEDRLTGHSLADSLARTREEASNLSRSLQAIETPKLEEIKLDRTITRIRNEIALKPPRGLPAAPIAATSNNVQISINGPFYIREEADIHKLAKAVGDIQMRQVIARRSRV
jgi:hypothetical protein